MTAARDLSAALDDLAEVFGDRLVAIGLGPHFTCNEAEIVADALRVGGHTTAAEVWLDGHAAGDESDDLHGAFGDGTASTDAAVVTFPKEEPDVPTQ